MRSKFFAAFVITYERSDTLPDILNKIKSQSLAPEKILIIDNSLSEKTSALIKSLNDPLLDYYRVGENSGPAGAAHHGVRILANEGYEWIYWGDDNDPPRTPDAFEKVIALSERLKDQPVGALGMMGNHFDFSQGKFIKIPSAKLKGIIEVDSISGGNTLIINGPAAKNCALPDPRMFFGLEELDYCTSLRKGGYKLFIDGDTYHTYRKLAGKTDDRPVSQFDNLSFDRRASALWREYYSIRNLLFIIAYKERRWWTVIKLVTKYLGKAVLSFRRGIKFGRVYFKLTLSAIFDALSGKMGRKYVPGSLKV